MSRLTTKNYVDFTGGLNYVDSPLNTRDRYLTKAINCELGYDSTIKKRNGFRLVKNISSLLSAGEKIVEIFYFNLHAILYSNQGRIYEVNEDNEARVIWNEDIAAQLTPDGGTTVVIWQHPEKRCFGTAAGSLFVLSNGYDKPLQISYNIGRTVQYLNDPGTGSNSEVPIIYRCQMVNHYLCAICLTRQVTQDNEVIYVPDNKLHISAKDQPGLWGDGAEARAAGSLEINVDYIIPMDNQQLVDVSSFRNQLCVFTDYSIIMFVLDNYVEKTVDDEQGGTVTEERHEPLVETVVENAGAVCAGSVQLAYDQSVFLSANGINSVKRNVISQNFVPESLSYKILPYVKSKFGELGEDGVRSVCDRRKFVYMIKWNDDTMLCMSFHKNLPEPCFWIWDEIKYTSFTNNVYGRVLATDGYGVFIYADDSEEFHEDEYIDETTLTQKSKTFKFDVVTPWLFYGKPSNVKSMQYIKIFSDGRASFDFQAAFDLQDTRKEIVDGEVVTVDNYELTIPLLGGEMEGYGSGLNQFYGGGIITSNENLIEYSQTFMYNKFRMTSNDNQPLRISCISVNYSVGGIRR